MTGKITRRATLAALGASASFLAAPAILRAAPAARLALYGPPAGPTFTLAHAVASGMLSGIADDVSLTVWRNPDELRAGLTSGSIDLSVVPAQAAANLYNRGLGIRLVNVMTNGLLYILAKEDAVEGGLAGLSGKSLIKGLIAGAVGGVSGYAGAAISAAAPGLPTGPIIVLVAAVLFLLSLFLAPARGVAAAVFRHRRFQRKVHRRQGLLALARQEPIHDELTLRVLRSEGLIRADGVATETGRAQAAKIARDERRWDVAREIHQDTGLTGRYDGLTPIEEIFAPDEIAEFDRRIGGPRAIGEGL